MYKLALKITGNERCARESISDAFLSIIENVKILKTDNEISLRAYILKILKNKCYDRIKSDSDILSLEEIEDISFDEDFEKELAEKEEAEIILKIIMKLPEKCRYALYFRYNENYSMSHIASLFDISEKTARKIIKDYLIKDDLFENQLLMNEAVKIAKNLINVSLENMKID